MPLSLSCWPLHDIVITNIVWCTAYIRGGWERGRILLDSRAIVLQQCGQCKRAERMKRRLIRARTTRSKTLYCKGQLSYKSSTRHEQRHQLTTRYLRPSNPGSAPESEDDEYSTPFLPNTPTHRRLRRNQAVVATRPVALTTMPTKKRKEDVREVLTAPGILF